MKIGIVIPVEFRLLFTKSNVFIFSVFVFGILAIAVSFIMSALGNTTFTIAGKIGMATGSISSLFLLGLLFPRIKAAVRTKFHVCNIHYYHRSYDTMS